MQYLQLVAGLIQLLAELTAAQQRVERDESPTEQDLAALEVARKLEVLRTAKLTGHENDL